MNIGDLLRVDYARVLIAFYRHRDRDDFLKWSRMYRNAYRSPYADSVIFTMSAGTIHDVHNAAGIQVTHLFYDYRIDPQSILFLKSRVRSSKYKGELVVESIHYDSFMEIAKSIVLSM